MGIEIERKFLLANESWRAEVQRSEHIRDGLVAASHDRKTRVRIKGANATLGVKTKRIEGRRQEFEYEIPLHDAERLMDCCGINVLEKIRHYIAIGGVVWEIDEYRGILKGVIVAEVELKAIDQRIDIPSWIGREVTADPSYSKMNMFRAATQSPGGRHAAFAHELSPLPC
jgi:adenylate cyclase